MRLVSDQSERDKATEWARKSVKWALRDLAANLMRITRGAGKPYEIGPQLGSLVNAFEEYREAAGCYPSSWEIQNALTLSDPTERWQEFDWGIRTMVHGGLQVAASELLGQGTQETAGRHELIKGLAVIERVRADNRRAVAPSFTKRKAQRKAIKKEELE